MGLIETALRAGIIPARIPNKARINTAVMAILKSTSGFRNIISFESGFPIALFTISTIYIPRAIPVNPATRVRKTDSEITVEIIFIGVAPMARFIPNS